MKKLIILSALMSLNTFSAERVLISDSKVADVELDTSSVRCSKIGYSVAELKINIKALDGWTLFDHSNINLGDFPGEPCMTAGTCAGGPGNGRLSIDDILSGGTRTESIKINRQIVEVKEASKDEQGADICLRHIEERLQTSVTRGDGNGNIAFTHKRAGLSESFPLSVCQK
ncbi:MAG: hypothetical protein ACXVLQ_04110 [Bacteriovorax sp.]